MQEASEHRPPAKKGRPSRGGVQLLAPRALQHLRLPSAVDPSGRPRHGSWHLSEPDTMMEPFPMGIRPAHRRAH